MKKINLSILAMLIILSGCKEDVKEETFKSKAVTINNETDFKFKDDEMNVYYQDNELIIYLEVTEYLENIEDMLVEDFVYEVDGDEVRLFVESDDEDSEMILNFKEDTVYSSYIDVGAYFFEESAAAEELLDEYSKYFMYDDAIESYEVIKEYQSVTYELEPYKMDMVKSGDEYYVPFHLLQFLVSEYSTKLVYNGDEFYYSEIFEEDTDVSEYSKDVEIDNELIEYNANFTKFIMENYYGLKDIVDYEEGVDSLYKEYKSGKENKQFREYDAFLANLGDMHTSHIDNVYTENFELSKEYSREAFSSFGFYISYCTTGPDTVTHKIISDSTAVVVVPDFSDERFATSYFEELEKVRGYENIVLDVSCNLGGYAANTDIFNHPFTNDKIYSYSGDVNGAQVKSFATKTEDTKLFDSNIYVLTSPSSYSAGNYAPIMFKDMGFGKTIGEASGGGTAAVSVLVMPNGSVISISSGSSLLYDKNFNHVEDGVSIDIPLTLYDYADLDEIYKAIDQELK